MSSLRLTENGTQALYPGRVKDVAKALDRLATDRVKPVRGYVSQRNEDKGTFS
jgi:hypothetical protein